MNVTRHPEAGSALAHRHRAPAPGAPNGNPTSRVSHGFAGKANSYPASHSGHSQAVAACAVDEIVLRSAQRIEHAFASEQDMWKGAGLSMNVVHAALNTRALASASDAYPLAAHALDIAGQGGVVADPAASQRRLCDAALAAVSTLLTAHRGAGRAVWHGQLHAVLDAAAITARHERSKIVQYARAVLDRMPADAYSDARAFASAAQALPAAMTLLRTAQAGHTALEIAAGDGTRLGFEVHPGLFRCLDDEWIRLRVLAHQVLDTPVHTGGGSRPALAPALTGYGGVVVVFAREPKHSMHVTADNARHDLGQCPACAGCTPTVFGRTAAEIVAAANDARIGGAS